MGNTPVNEKICKDCQQPKPVDQFHKRSANADGLHIRCKECFATKEQPIRLQHSREYLKTHKKELREKAIKKYRESQKDSVAHKELIFKRNIKKLYGMSLEQYYTLLRQQENLCKICRRTNTNGRRLSVDHNHTNGKIRGLLCGPCNVAIGMLQEDTNRLQTVIQYLTS